VATAATIAPEAAALPIGCPIAGVAVRLLDRELRPAPLGVAGEVCLAGRGLARGYLHRPEQTAERFVPDPLAGDGGRLYRTGDLARFRTDGRLEFLGRIDRQVKVRGFRIELGEVEAALARQPGVTAAAVVAREAAAGGQQLVAFVVPAAPAAIDPLALRDSLSRELPEAMVPASFVVLDALPLTANGKLDRRALAALEVAADGEAERLAPRDVLELRLATIWRDVLGVEQVGVRDGFFALGGHSLLAVQLLARVEQELGRELPLSTLFAGGTIEAMAALLRQGGDAPAGGLLVPIQPHGARPPLFCVHPAGGDVLCFAALAERLGADQPVYGVEARGLSSAAPPLDRIEARAAAYLQEIRRVQPSGPYWLAGWSFGGLVAYEMARQLAAHGERVSLLALLDSSADAAGEGGAIDDTSALLDIAGYVGNLWGRPLPLTRDDLDGRPFEKQLDVLVDRLRAADLLPVGAGAAQLARFVRVYRANTAAVAAYVPGPYTDAITVLKAEADGAAPHGDLGWGRLSSQPVEVLSVPGGHTTLLSAPHVDRLAETLRACLDRAASGALAMAGDPV
ncbi:MAG TPA: thioesterase domain-containing protein, partial [Thermoanaerobaculia bacterium]